MEQLGSYVCRKAKYSDIPSMYTLIETLLPEEEKRKVTKFFKYYIKLNSSFVVEDGNEIVGLCSGKDNFVHYFVSKGGPKSTLLLLYVVLCGVHNRYEDSRFKAFDSNIELFKKLRDRSGKACIIDNETNEGIVHPITKNHIEQLYRKFKND